VRPRIENHVQKGSHQLWRPPNERRINISEVVLKEKNRNPQKPTDDVFIAAIMGYSVNIAIGLQVLLGALTTGIAAAVQSGRQVRASYQFHVG